MGDVNCTRQRMIDIESTVTPVRGHLMRQHSTQSKNRAPLISSVGVHAASLDIPSYVAQPAADPLPGQASHRHKLLQLQLLHNSNNVDYVRQGFADNQIYGPDSTANVYGYSSMRSNLKSVASEFSFIRPSSSSGYNQSTLPHQITNMGPNAQVRQSKLMPTTGQLIANNHPSGVGSNDDNNNRISYLDPVVKEPFHGQQFLINPETGQRLLNDRQSLLQGELDLISPPEGRLPLKPNKKRNQSSTGNGKQGANASLTSSIAAFIKRAFSRRSKRHPKQQKLVGSCSSSLGPLDDGATNVPLIPSAFSTGSKSIDESSRGCRSGFNQQSLRMVDMIEAFNNKTLIDGSNATRIDITQDVIKPSFEASSAAFRPDAHRDRTQINQFGSPLHKSNSISTTTGWDMTEVDLIRTPLHHRNLHHAIGRSPSMRSNKVMSAHITPSELNSSQQNSRNFIILSPRTDHHQLARPSSIYGQPSMISSPIINRDDRSRFGLQRNSLRSQPSATDRCGSSSAFEFRRQQLIRGSLLDTTREVAEEVSSPVDESVSALYQLSQEQPTNFAPTPSSRSKRHSSPQTRFLITSNRSELDPESPISMGQMQYKRAIVNPILQSPTMDTIYDNHPLFPNLSTTHSLYDNHGQLAMTTSMSLNDQRSPMLDRKSSQIREANLVAGRLRDQNNPPQGPYYASSDNPTRYIKSSDEQSMSTYVTCGAKPAAIVAPSTPNHELSASSRGNQDLSNSPMRDTDTYMSRPSPVGKSVVQRSPMMGRRGLHGQVQYQQSPLVSMQTRVLTKSDGVQATIVSDNHRHTIVNLDNQSNRNLGDASAPHILGRIGPLGDQVYNRELSQPKEINQTKMSDNHQQSSTQNEMNQTDDFNSSNQLVPSRMYNDSLFSNSVSSSIGEESARSREVNGAHDDRNGSRGGSSGGNTLSSQAQRENREEHSKRSQPSSLGSLRRDSSSEPSDGTSFSGSPGHTEERQWITSKLAY